MLTASSIAQPVHAPYPHVLSNNYRVTPHLLNQTKHRFRALVQIDHALTTSASATGNNSRKEYAVQHHKRLGSNITNNPNTAARTIKENHSLRMACSAKSRPARTSQRHSRSKDIPTSYTRHAHQSHSIHMHRMRQSKNKAKSPL